MGIHARSRAAVPVLIGIVAAIVAALIVVLLFVVLKPGGGAVTTGKPDAPSGKWPTISENGHAGASASHESPAPGAPDAPSNTSPSTGRAPSGEPTDIGSAGAATANPEAFASLPAPTNPDVEPDNDVDAETGEQLPSPATGQSSGTGQTSATTTPSTALPDNDVSVS